ncbi:uroporphyrinogen-III synthase [Achlya hypogyna]|uniref:Uroporphyrinogen-III synthase n=1 Tax=Achlya hypogyna TaxID=1202772 RepID=A0A1V9ZFU9_ACHHY|nr:uroporphyrinogen-III synthase [Achlya hypogyna]
MATSALLLKSDDIKYREVFGAAGYTTSFSDVLTFEARNRDELAARLLALATYDSLIVTSPRASQAIVDTLQALPAAERPRVLAQLQVLQVFSVGKKTSEPLTAIGVACLGEDSGSGDVLAPYIASMQDPTSTKPTLFVCGEKHHDALPTSFRERGRVLEEIVVYASAAVETIAYFADPTAERPAWVAFFSPSGVHTARRVVAVDWTRIKKVAIGKTTATALAKAAEETGDASWAAATVAAKPTAEGLVEAMVAFDAQLQTTIEKTTSM